MDRRGPAFEPAARAGSAPPPPPLVRVVDVLLALLVGPPLLIDLVAGRTGNARLWLLTVAVAALGALAVAVRSRAAFAGVLGLSAASTSLSWIAHDQGWTAYPGVAVPVALGLLLMPIVRSDSVTRATLAVVVAGGSVLASSELPSSSAPLITLVLLGVVAGGVGFGLYQRWLDWTRRQATELARQDERLALARELHDVVAHHVTGIVVQAQAARFVADRDPGAAHAALSAIESAGAEALLSMRTMVGALRGDEPAPSAPTAGLASLDGLVEGARAAGHPVVFELDPSLEGAVPDAVAGAVYRVVQEALTNVRRHAQPSASVVVQVVRDADQVDVWVHNDGEPRAARSRLTAGGGFGLVGMTERVDALGGAVAAGPSTSTIAGWDVRALVPIGQGGDR